MAGISQRTLQMHFREKKFRFLDLFSNVIDLCGALMLSVKFAGINCWKTYADTGGFRRYSAAYVAVSLRYHLEIIFE